MPATAAGVALPNNNISGVGGAVATQTIVRTLYDYNPFAVLQQVLDRHDEQVPDFRFFLKGMGMSRGVDAPITGHYEDDWKNNLVKVGAITTASTGAGTSVVLTLHADSMFNAGATTGATGGVAGSAAQASNVRVNDIILFGSDKKALVIAKDTSVSPHRITVRPLLSTVDLAGATVVGSSYAIPTNAFAEGWGLPDGEIPRLLKYTNTFQIVKARASVTGSEYSNRLFVQFSQQSDGSLFGAIEPRMFARFERAVSGALLFGGQINNIVQFSTDNGVDVPVTGTEGFWDFATGLGHIQTYTVGAYAMANFDNIARVMQGERIGNNRVLMTLEGYEIFIETENLLKSEFSNNLIPFLMKGMVSRAGYATDEYDPFQDPDYMAANFGFRAVKKAGFSTMFKLLHEFSDITLGGAAAYTYANTRLVCPLGFTKDAKTKKDSFIFGYEYKQRDGYSREAIAGTFGGIGGGFTPASGPIDSHTAGMLAEVAFHGATPNRVIVQRPA